MQSTKPKLAIVGTGMSGLACADGLGQNFEISLFDKSRGLSGRLSTRRGESHAFDHGAQYFRSGTKLFARARTAQKAGTFAVMDAAACLL